MFITILHSTSGLYVPPSLILMHELLMPQNLATLVAGTYTN